MAHPPAAALVLGDDDEALLRSWARSSTVPAGQGQTWDQAKELSNHQSVSVDAGIDIYFCDPRSPWQRPSNENTNGLLRQYFPKGTDLNTYSTEDLAFVAHLMNDRPRKRLDYAKPHELMMALPPDRGHGVMRLLDLPRSGCSVASRRPRG